jgi:hypothetical protein
MIYSSDLLKQCSAIKIPNLSKYLRDKGWKSLENLPGNRNFYCFQKPYKDDFLQIDVPMRSDLIDFNECMLQACEQISQEEQRGIEGVVFDLLNPMADILRFHAQSDNIKNGTLPIEDALQFFENSKKLVLASAGDLILPRTYRLRKYPESANALVDQCRFGQTEIGSYVVTLVCPLVQEEQGKMVQMSLFDELDETAFCLTRKTVNKLLTSLALVKETIDQGKSLDTLIDSKSSNFVSVNFLESLSNMGLENPGSLIQTSVKWAPTVTQNRVEQSNVAIGNEYFEVIHSKVQAYKNKVDSVLFDQVGKISKTWAEPDLAQRKEGTIQLIYLTKEGQARSISIVLSPENYDTALEAHKLGKTVRVTGTMANNRKVIEADLTVIE